jgi:hypothetical protein
MHATPYLFQSGTYLFVAKRGDEVIGTMTLIGDSERGLPMDSIYCEELAPLRRRGRRLAEVGALCTRAQARRSGVTFLLNKIMWFLALRAGFDELVIAIHPCAEELYRAWMMFERVGGERRYPGLRRQAVAVAMCLDLRQWDERARVAFGTEARDGANPYHVYVERQHPQIERLDLAEGTADVRRRAASKVLSAIEVGTPRAPAPQLTLVPA